jgi:hypothetical protein
MEASKANVKGTSNLLSRLWQNAHGDVQATWQSAVKRFVDGSPLPSIMSCRDRLEEDFRISAGNMPVSFWWSSFWRKLRERMRIRLHKELDDVEFRLGQGLEECNQFWGGDELVRARHSRAKWLSMRWSDKAELEFYSRALKTRNDIIYIDFWGCDIDCVVETIRDLPSLTSVLVRNDARARLRDIQRDSPLFMDGTNISTFLDDNQSRLAETRRTFIFTSNQGPILDFSSTEIGLDSPIIAISFFGSSSGCLTLRLRHRSSRPDATLSVTGFPSFKLPIPSSLTTNDITLHPHPSEHLSFTPDSRNNLIIQVEASRSEHYWLQDIQLLDEAGHPHNPWTSEAPDLPLGSSTSK